MDLPLKIFLPVALLALSFVMKLMIGRKVSTPDVIQAFCELPVDMMFLAISFLVASIISEKGNSEIDLKYSFISIPLAFIVLLFWRICSSLQYNKWWWVPLFLTNLLVATFVVGFSIHAIAPTNSKGIDNKGKNNNQNVTSPKNSVKTPGNEN